MEKLAPISLNSATGINSVVLKIKAAEAKAITQTHWRVTEEVEEELDIHI